MTTLHRLTSVALLAAGLSTAAAQAPKALDRAPRSANPYTAFLPAGVVPDYAYWDTALAREATARMARLGPARRAALVYDEVEAADARGANDDFDTAEVIGGFGTSADAALRIRGGFAPAFDGTPVETTPFPEEDGSIGTASDTGLSNGAAIVIRGAVLGDGAFGATTGDFDFYAVTVDDSEPTLIVDIDTPTGDLDPTLTVIDAAGNVGAFNDDTDGLDSYIEVKLPGAGTYYVIVSSYDSAPGDVTDPASGDGANTTGPYDLLIGLGAIDQDAYAFDLRAGDIIGVGDGTGGVASVELYAPDGELRIGSQQDLSGIYPTDSPLLGAGASLASAAFVAPADGRYRLLVKGSGPYEVGVLAFRPRLEADPAVERQTLFIDFDGATIDAVSLFGGGNATATLSPLSAFLPGWGLEASDEDALIDAILASLEETLRDDFLTAGNNRASSVEILNSRDHADPFGQPGVSRLIVGGTIDELGIETIGIASTIDPGNFGLEDTAVTLLDLLSIADPTDDSFPNSLNQYAVAGGATRIDVVAQGVGNITAHEAGHFLGLFHTDQFNDVPNIIDQGGNLANTVGVGADLTLGTADDVDVDFVPDEFVAGEGLIGIEDGTNAIAFALSTRLPVSVVDGPAAAVVRAYPNPVVAGAGLRVEAGTEGRVVLYDALGRLAARASVDAAGAATIRTEGLAPGAYFVRIDDGADVRVVPVTVVR